MAFLLNPLYGTQPGAARGLNWWEGPQFRMSDLLATLPPAQSPLAPATTPQDEATQSGAIEMRTDTGGGEGGYASGLDRGPDRGGTAMSTGGPPAADTEKGLWGTVGAPPGSPAAYNSNYGGILGGLGTVAGTALGVPGVGMLGGIVGSNIDLHNYTDALRAAGIAIAPDYLAASIAGALPSLPGTNIGQWLSEQLGIPSARSQSETARRDALAMGMMTGNTTLGPTAIDDVDKTILDNPEIFGLANVGYQGPAVAAFDPASLGREAGYGGIAGVMGAPQDQTGYQSGTYQSSIAGGSPDSQAGYGGAPSTGGGVDPSGGGRGAGGGDTGRDTGFFYRGGLIGAPPGRYAAGGEVRGALSPQDEQAFQYAMRFTSPYRDWYRDFNARFGEPPDLDTPDYNTREAWRRGVQPAPYEHDDGHYHWESAVDVPPRARPMELKSEQHPTRWMQTFMDRYGTDPNEASPEQLAQALRDGVVPMTPGDAPGRYAAGGMIPQAPGDNISPAQFGALRAINPPGPDDQIGALQTGEGVLTRAAMAKYKGLLDAANAGTLDPGRVKGLLAPARPRRVR